MHKQWPIIYLSSDDSGLRSPVIQKLLQTKKSARTSIIVACVQSMIAQTRYSGRVQKYLSGLS